MSVLLALQPVTYRLIADAGSYTLSGQDVGLRAIRKIQADAGSYSLSGQNVGLRAVRKLVALAGSYSLDGQDVALVYTPAAAGRKPTTMWTMIRRK